MPSKGSTDFLKSKAARISVPSQAWGQRLQYALNRRGVRKLYALAVELGVDESALSRWRQGRSITLANAVTLCQTLDISLDWLLLGRGEMEEHRSSGLANLRPNYTPSDLPTQPIVTKDTPSTARELLDC
ncbi:MAG: helix-turn-helix domain-containing protein [Asticcacaulis sp.]